jgi:hypothetical protein
MISAALFLATACMLFYVVKYRIHIHVTYQRPAASTRRRPPEPPPAAQAPRPAGTTTITAVDLAATLVGLGMSKTEAKRAAARAIRRGAATDDQLIRIAIQEAQAA